PPSPVKSTATVMSDAARLPAPNSAANSRGSQSVKKETGVMSRGGRLAVVMGGSLWRSLLGLLFIGRPLHTQLLLDAPLFRPRDLDLRDLIHRRGDHASGLDVEVILGRALAGGVRFVGAVLLRALEAPLGAD